MGHAVVLCGVFKECWAIGFWWVGVAGAVFGWCSLVLVGEQNILTGLGGWIVVLSRNLDWLFDWRIGCLSRGCVVNLPLTKEKQYQYKTKKKQLGNTIDLITVTLLLWGVWWGGGFSGVRWVCWEGPLVCCLVIVLVVWWGGLAGCWVGAGLGSLDLEWGGWFLELVVLGVEPLGTGTIKKTE